MASRHQRLLPALELAPAAALLVAAALFGTAWYAYDHHYSWARSVEVIALWVIYGHFAAGLGWLCSGRPIGFMVWFASRLAFAPLFFVGFVLWVSRCDVDSTDPCNDTSPEGRLILLATLAAAIATSIVSAWMLARRLAPDPTAA